MKLSGKLLTFCAAAATLAACSGSDKQDPAGREIAYTGSTTALVISPTNVASIASLADAAALSSVGSASGGVGYLGAASADRRVGPQTALAIVQKARRDFGPSLVGAFASVTQPCPGGGTMTMSMSQASDTVATTGDYVELSATSCNDGQGSTLNGSLRVDITSTDGMDPTLGPTSMTSGFPYGMSLAATDFSIEDATGWVGLEGAMELTQTWYAATYRLQSTIEGASFISATGVGSTITDASLIAALPSTSQFSLTSVEEYTDATATMTYATESGINARLCSLELAGCINIEMTQPFRQLMTELYPASGSMRIFDDLGHYIQLDPTDGTTGAVTVSWEAVLGTPTPDGTCYTTWSTMSTDSCFP